jgi:hypothetical protein
MKEKKIEYRGKGKSIPEKLLKDAKPTVVKLAQLGCSDKEIASIVGISEASIERHMRTELDEGRGTMRASLRKAQIELAIKEKNPTMLIWLGKCYLGQKEPKHNVEHSGGITVEKIMFGAAEEAIKQVK